MLSGLILPAPSGLLAIGGWLPIGWAGVFVCLELPTLLGLGVRALAVRAKLALLVGLSRRSSGRCLCSRYVRLHHFLEHLHHLLELLFLI